MNKLAIVILSWNGAALMRRYLPSVINNSVGDVIVVDNASTDDSVPMLAEIFPEIRTIILDKNYGYAEGYNRALSQLREEYEYFLLLNSDVEIRQKNWDKILIDYMDTHKECAACMPKLLDLHKLEEMERTASQTSADCSLCYFEYAGAAGGFLDKYGYPFCRGRIFATVEKDTGQYDTIAPVHWATGAAMLIRSADYFEAGGLDSGFFAHMEEIDLCWRLRILGKQIVCLPQSTAYHFGGASLNYGHPNKTFLNFRNSLLMLYKNLPQKELKSVLAVRFLFDMAAALKMLLTLRFSHAGAIIKAEADFYKNRGKWNVERTRIQGLRSADSTSERESFSLLWQYYANGRKTYSSLNKLCCSKKSE